MPQMSNKTINKVCVKVTLETLKRRQLKTLVDIECIQHIKQNLIYTTVTRELIFGNIWQWWQEYFEADLGPYLISTTEVFLEKQLAAKSC